MGLTVSGSSCWRLQVLLQLCIALLGCLNRLAVLTWLLSWRLTPLAQEVCYCKDVAMRCTDNDARSPGPTG